MYEKGVRNCFIAVCITTSLSLLVGFLLLFIVARLGGWPTSSLNGVLFTYREPGTLFLMAFAFWTFLAVGSAFATFRNGKAFAVLTDRPYEQYKLAYATRVFLMSTISVSIALLAAVIDVSYARLQ